MNHGASRRSPALDTLVGIIIAIVQNATNNLSNMAAMNQLVIFHSTIQKNDLPRRSIIVGIGAKSSIDNGTMMSAHVNNRLARFTSLVAQASKVVGAPNSIRALYLFLSLLVYLSLDCCHGSTYIGRVVGNVAASTSKVGTSGLHLGSVVCKGLNGLLGREVLSRRILSNLTSPLGKGELLGSRAGGGQSGEGQCQEGGKSHDELSIASINCD